MERWGSFETYSVTPGELNQVESGRVVRVFVRNVLQRRLLPGDINGSEIDAPNDNVLTVRGSLCDSNIDVEMINLVQEGGSIDRVLHPGCQNGGLVAVAWVSKRSGAGFPRWSACVGEDGFGFAIVVRTCACSNGGGTEPVVTDGLVSLEDYVVPLANCDHDGLGREGLDWDKIAGDNLRQALARHSLAFLGAAHSEEMVVQRYTNAVIRGRVNEPETVLLALL